MSNEPIAISVRILDKEYRISCEPHEEAGLRESARMLDHRMRELRKTGRVVGSDRIALMSALNIAYELIKIRSGQAPSDQDLERCLGDLQQQLSDALATQDRMDEEGKRV